MKPFVRTLSALMSGALTLMLSAVVAQAQFSQVMLPAGDINSNIDTYTNGFLYPPNGGPLTVGGVPFTLAAYPGGGTGVIQDKGTGAASNTWDIPIGITNAVTVYTLMNSAWGAYGTNIASLEFKGANGATYTQDLIEGTNIRDHNNDGYNNLIAPGTPSAEFGGGQVRLDEQTFTLPSSFANTTLTDIIFTGNGNFPQGEAFLAAATVSTAISSAVPEPGSATILFSLGMAGAGVLLRRRRA